MTDFIQVITTIDNREQAQRIAAELVQRKLAACVQIAGPVESVYRWKGQVERAQEFQCWIKTTRERFDALERAIHELHTYDVPEILALPVLAASESYASWIAAEVSDRPSES